jgi:putative transposase
VQVLWHQPGEGTPNTPQTAPSRRRSTGKGYGSFSGACAEPWPLPESGQPVGLDGGRKTVAPLSTGAAVANPRCFRQAEQALAKAPRRLSKAEQGPAERAARRKGGARVPERIAWRRRAFPHQRSRRSSDAFDRMAVEDLAGNRLPHHPCLATRIQDVAWSQVADLLSYTAAWAGRRSVAVKPASTTQDCSPGGQRQARSLSDRTSRCPCCGVILDRDLNAAQNMLRVGRQSLALA